MFTKYKMFIFSQDVDKLLPFYTDVLGLTVVGELKLPRDYGYSVRVAPGYDLWIATHSGVQGQNRDMYRQMLNLYTDEVETYYNRVKDYPGVKILQEPVPMSEFNPDEKTRYVCTFTDPEGNVIQVMGLRKPV